MPDGVIDDLDQHLPEAGSLDRAALPLGMFLAWCGNLQLVSGAFLEVHQGVLVRLRYRDLSPAEFLTSVTNGSIDLADLNSEGQAFASAYYPRYLDDFRSVFGPDIYEITDDWAHYDQIAAVLTRHFMTWKGLTERKREKLFTGEGGERKWWHRWRS